MSPRTRDSVVLTIAVAALLGIAFVQQQTQRSNLTRSTFSSYDLGPNGYRALYAVLERAGVTVGRLQHPLSTLDGSGTLVVSDNEKDPAPIAFDKSDRDALRRFVAEGGRLVVLASSFAGSRDVVPQIPQTGAASIRVAFASPALRTKAGVRTVAAPAESSFAASPHATAVLYARGRSRVAIVYRIGKGLVVASTSPASFSNAQLLQRDNVRFAYAILAGHGRVMFDEYAHGYSDDETFWQAVPQTIKWALLLAGIVVVVALVGANVPFAPPVPLDAPDERTNASYVDAMASLLRRACARGDAMRSLARSVARAPRIRANAAAVAEFEKLLASPQTDSVLCRAATIEFELRKERV